MSGTKARITFKSGFFFYTGFVVLSALIWGCDDSEKLTALPPGNHAIFVVCEGNYGTANSSLDIIDTFYTDTVHHDVFYRVNQRRLGKFAHSMITIDSFGLIMITQSNTIEIIHTSTFELMNTISARSPRHAAFDGNKIFVTSYMDSQIVVISYPQWTIEKTVKITHKPDRIVIAGTKLLIGNSDTLFSAARQDSNITIMDAGNPSFHYTVHVGKTPVSIVASPQDQKAYIACKGSSTVAGSIAVLDLLNDQVTGRIGVSDIINPVQLALCDSILACIRKENGSVRLYNRITGIMLNDISANAYTIHFCGRQLLITDARDFISPGRLLWYNEENARVHNYKTGIAPAHIYCKQ